MWAVGRISLLSWGRATAASVPGARVEDSIPESRVIPTPAAVGTEQADDERPLGIAALRVSSATVSVPVPVEEAARTLEVPRPADRPEPAEPAPEVEESPAAEAASAAEEPASRMEAFAEDEKPAADEATPSIEAVVKSDAPANEAPATLRSEPMAPVAEPAREGFLMRLWRRFLAFLRALFLPLLLLFARGTDAAPPSSPACDIVFEGGRIVDGTGAPWFRGDVCLKDGRIAAIGSLKNPAARRRIDASKLVIAPGFIDMMGQSEYRLLVDGRGASKITQGITTEITGEGSSIAPLNERLLAAGRPTYAHFGYTPTFTTLRGYFDELEKRGTSLNLGTFVGAGGLRSLVIGDDDRKATPSELDRMKALAAEAMEDGALGVSTSLIYVPDHFASTEEIVELAKVAARYGGSYITHQRDEGDDNGGGLDASMDEVMRIAREAGLPAEIYHLKASGSRNWGRMKDLLRRIDEARAQGLDISADQYPWAASSNNLDASLPFWVREGGAGPMVARLRDPVQRAKARVDFLKLPENADWPAGAARILVTAVLNPALKPFEGQTIQDIATAARKDPIDVIMDIVADDGGNTARVSFTMSEEDVRLALRHPFVSFSTDSGASAEDGPFSKQKSHPRAWGSAARILGYYVREQKVLALEEAIRKMTSLPASRMRLADRGLLRPGMAADVVAFDPDTVAARATYADPLHYSAGIPFVAVNRVLVVDEGRITAARPGRALRGPGYRPKSASARR